MNAFPLDLTKILPHNSFVNVHINQKGPLKPETMTYAKDGQGHVTCTYQRPTTLNIDGQKINNVKHYMVTNYTDGVTNNGKLYNIERPHSDMVLYTRDNKFAMSRENFFGVKTVQVGPHKIKGQISKEVLANGITKFEAITNNFNIKTITVKPDGSVIGPEKGLIERLGKGIAKQGKTLSKLLKFF